MESQLVGPAIEAKVGEAIEELQHVHATKFFKGNQVPPSIAEIKAKIVEIYKCSKAV